MISQRLTPPRTDDVPSDVAGYVHAAGRTGRAGRDGVVTCLVESQAQAGQYRSLHALQPAPRLFD